MSKSYKDILKTPMEKLEEVSVFNEKKNIRKHSSIFLYADAEDKTEKRYSGYVMCEDEPVAIVVNDSLTISNEELCPFYLRRTKNFLGWLATRSIDTHRTNSRLLRKVLRLTDVDDRYDDSTIALASNAASITDRYWFKSVDSKLSYRDASNFSDYLSDTALLGDVSVFESYSNELTPEFTNVGSFEKCWKYMCPNWYLIKKASPAERFSEYLAYKLGRYIGFDIAEYSLDYKKPNIIFSKDFTKQGDISFEPMHSLVDDAEDYLITIRQLELLEYSYNVELVKSFLDIVLLDGLVFNFDRHTNNYGILRKFNKDTMTNDVIGMAPNFDNNLSLVSRKLKEGATRAPMHFLGLVVDLSEDYPNYHIPSLTYQEIKMIVEGCMIECNFSFSQLDIAQFIYNNYLFIKENCKNWV